MSYNFGGRLLVFLFILASLLQTFCYGAEGIPEEEHPFLRSLLQTFCCVTFAQEEEEAEAEVVQKRERKCTLLVDEPEVSRSLFEDDGRMHAFFYEYLKKFYDAFQGKGGEPPPARNDVPALLTWTEQYFTKNQLGVSSESCKPVVSDRLVNALKTLKFKKTPTPSPKTYVVPECLPRSMITVVENCEPGHLYFFASQKRFLTELDFNIASIVLHHQMVGLKHLLLTEPFTEFQAAMYISTWLMDEFNVKISVIPTQIGENDLDIFEKTMTSIKDFLAQNESVVFDGMVCVFPSGFPYQKIANHILKRSVPCYDVYLKKTNNLEVLQALAYALYIEAKIIRE